MKELARKRLFSIIEIEGAEYLDFGDVMGYVFKVSPEELSDLKDCINEATKKKWKKTKNGDNLTCPTCYCTNDIVDHFCYNCGQMCEGVEE